VALVLFIAILLRGQIFGRPVPLTTDKTRRAPVEYITAIANLHRRAGHRTELLQHYRQQLKRALGQRYRLAPDTPDDEYVRLLADYNPAVNADSLRALLARLNQKSVSESDLIEIANHVAVLTKEQA
jgi:hypothetical protein